MSAELPTPNRTALARRLAVCSALLCAVGVAVVLSTAAAPTAGAIAAQAVPPAPAPPPPGAPKPKLLVIGDSVLEGTYDKIPAALPEWDVTVDAHLNRNTGDALGIVQTRGTAFDAVVVQLGTNDSGSPAIYQPRVIALMDALAPVPRVLWLTIHEVRPYYYDANQIIRAAAAQHGNVQVLDWNLAVAPGDTYADGLHLTPQGGDAMAAFIAAALRAPAQPFATTTTTTTTTTTVPATTVTTPSSEPAPAPVRDRAVPPPAPDGGPSGPTIIGLTLVVLALAAVPLLVVWRRRRNLAGHPAAPDASAPYDT